jgi:DNA-binding IclR family transcriptional regulator
MKTASLVQSLDRGLELLEAVAAQPQGLTLAEMAEFLEVSQPAAFNLAGTLVHRGYLVKTSKPVRYRLGRAVLDLTQRFLAAGHEEERGEAMLELASRLDLGRGGVVLGEMLGGSFIFSMRVEGQRPGVLQRVTQRLPTPYHMATPLCLMAFMDADARALVEEAYPFHELGRGFWQDETELEAFLARVREQGYLHLDRGGPFRAAAPIFDAAGNLSAGLGMNRRENEVVSPADKDALLNGLRETAARLSSHLAP